MLYYKFVNCLFHFVQLYFYLPETILSYLITWHKGKQYYAKPLILLMFFGAFNMNHVVNINDIV